MGDAKATDIPNAEDTVPAAKRKKILDKKRDLREMLSQVENNLRTINETQKKRASGSTDGNTQHNKRKNPNGSSDENEPKRKRRRSARSSAVTKHYTADETGATPQKKPPLSYALKQCKTILAGLMRHRLGWPFNQPVDANLLGIPDYHTIIKHPMDLGTINTKLSNGEYVDELDFATDVRLVWKNALLYNQPKSDIAGMTRTLMELFEKKFLALQGRIAAREEKVNPDISETVNKLTQSVEALKREISKMQGGTPPKRATGRRRTRKSGATPTLNTAKMTYTEKKRLSQKINELPAEHLSEVVNIISSSMPELCKEGDELEIDIGLLNTTTLRLLEQFVKKVLQKTAPKRKRKRGINITEATLEQAQQAELGTQNQIAEVERKLEELKNRNDNIIERGIARSTGNAVPPLHSPTTEPATPPPATPPVPVAQKLDDSDSSASSDSGSDSHSSDSDSSGSSASDSDD
eukprot:TRINITY_DN314_c0_g2_i1.p1 TRINITY_DN314_c0_g2~~TRINITY_DN314_c0_g2_i1.p1  ORF type:complete len:466 (+),score=102.87 TRINITY_DN314_c0_g2_i1:207-1604(+)